jgi:hypothetical protein
MESLGEFLVAVLTMESVLRHDFSPGLMIALMPVGWNIEEDKIVSAQPP